MAHRNFYLDSSLVQRNLILEQEMGGKKDDPQAQHKRKSDDTQGKSTQEKKSKLEMVPEENEPQPEEQHEEQEVPEQQEESEEPEVITIPEPTPQELEEIFKLV